MGFFGERINLFKGRVEKCVIKIHNVCFSNINEYIYLYFKKMCKDFLLYFLFIGKNIFPLLYHKNIEIRSVRE